jgi:hypothetical protein
MELIVRPMGSYRVTSKDIELLFELGNAGGTFGFSNHHFFRFPIILS